MDYWSFLHENDELSKGIMAVRSEIRTKPINKFCGQNALLNHAVHMVTIVL